MALGNAVPPAFHFQPRPQHKTPGMQHNSDWRLARPEAAAKIYASSSWGEAPRERPANDLDLAFAPVAQLSDWVRRRRVSCVELAEFYLDRLALLDPQLHFVITLTAERAREQARELDRELRRGHWRGPLHGIPWGAKDLLAVEGYPTTWGAAPYRDQSFDADAEVVRRLDEAGAVLVAKTSVGALAWGDVWFDATTKNPWKLDQGSSGSSAGSASAVAAGALPFALGTETLGSIISPCSRCGATGLRPTHGRVPRTGCMALSWTMDKIGPIARNVEDAAIVLAAIHGSHAGDSGTVSAPIRWMLPDEVGRFRFGYSAKDFEQDYPQAATDRASLEVIRSLGVELEAISLPELPVGDMLVVLEVEAAAAFDELTRSNRDDELVRQVEQAWPNVFRAAQLVPAVQYVQAMRARTVLMEEMNAAMGDVEGYVCPSFAGPSLLITNLTGHPAVVLPNGFREDGTPTSISFVGRIHGEGAIVGLASAYQRATDWNRKRPPL
jgi:Asp-tRNA(Asn)/Glu-tRNA(Gln) amidotransferase A subunit family amidase